MALLWPQDGQPAHALVRMAAGMQHSTVAFCLSYRKVKAKDCSYQRAKMYLKTGFYYLSRVPLDTQKGLSERNPLSFTYTQY